MTRKFTAIIVLLLCIASASQAQSKKKTAIVKGKLVNAATKAPFNDLKISIPALNVFTTSDGDGNFEISEVPFGAQSVTISNYNAKAETININVDKDVVDMGDILITPNDAGASPESLEIPTIALEENTASEDDGVSLQSSGGLVIASRDPFVSTLTYVFGIYQFRPRGYARSAQEIQVNGTPINDLETGFASWNMLGGLTDVFRSRDIVYGLNPSDYMFGGLNGSAYIEATAADQRKGMDVSYTITDRNYNNRIMVTANTGMMNNGWAFSVSASRRWAQEGYVPGTSYDGYSYYAAASKKIGKGTLNLTTFGSPTYDTKPAAATKEADSLAGTHYYNHNWGYDDGKIRNFATRNVYQPITILNYEYKPSDKTRWNTAVSYEFGKDRNGNGYYLGASNPMGDYYKKLPSYYLNIVPQDPTTATALRTAILNNPNVLQLNWDDMYAANKMDTGYVFYNTSGVAVTKASDRLSHYILADKVNALKKFTFNSNIEHAVNENMTVTGGLTVASQSTEIYSVITDLLGGDYFLDNNSFATQQSVAAGTTSNNLKAPSPVVRVGDKIDYDYLVRYNNGLVWGQAVYMYDKFGFFLSANAGATSFSRDGFMENAVFPTLSYGKSAAQTFFDYAVKGGINYKIDARNLLFVNAAFSTTPPTADNTYVSPETRDVTVSGITPQRNKTLEAGYMLSSSKLTARLVGYVSDATNVTEIKRFYNDDPAYNTFVNYVMQGESTRNIGTELALDYKLMRGLSIIGVASVGQAFYTDNPTIAVYQDNDTSHQTSRTFIKNYFLSAGPQTAATLGFNYRPKFVKNAYINLNFNYFDRNYVSINPNRRTVAAAAYYSAGTPEWHAVFDQEKLPSAFTVDLRFGKNFQLSKKWGFANKISHNTVLALSGGISNLLNNTNVINTGFEQLRYDFTNNIPAKFPNKYIYGPGINFFLNISLRF